MSSARKTRAKAPKKRSPVSRFAKRGPPNYFCTDSGEVWAKWRGVTGGTVMQRIR